MTTTIKPVLMMHLVCLHNGSTDVDGIEERYSIEADDGAVAMKKAVYRWCQEHRNEGLPIISHVGQQKDGVWRVVY